MKAGPKEQMQRQLGPTGIERQLGSSLKASYTARKPVTTVTKLQQSVTRVTNKSVTANNSVTLTYREGLDRLGVEGIMGSLKDLCIRAAGGEVEPEPNPEPEEPPSQPPPLGHDGMAV
jgi:hypothetical protein